MGGVGGRDSGEVGHKIYFLFVPWDKKTAENPKNGFQRDEKNISKALLTLVCLTLAILRILVGIHVLRKNQVLSVTFRNHFSYSSLSIFRTIHIVSGKIYIYLFFFLFRTYLKIYVSTPCFFLLYHIYCLRSAYKIKSPVSRSI